MGKSKLRLRIFDNEYEERSAKTQGITFTTIKRAIPDSNYVSLILLNEALGEPQYGADIIYLPDTGNRENLLDRLRHALKAITIYPVQRSWCEWLLEEAKFEYDRDTRSRLITPLHNDENPNSRYFQTRGFRLWQMIGNRIQWEELISKGLSRQKISIADES